MKVLIKNIDDITIQEFRKINSIINTEEEGLERDISIISILTDMSAEELAKFDYKSIQDLLEVINNILSNYEVYEEHEVTIKDIKYVFDTNLDKMSTGMFVDLYNFTKTPEDIISNLHIVAAILYRPINKKKIEAYDSETVMARSEIFDSEMSITVAQSAAFIFLELKKKGLRTTLVYLENQLKSTQTQM